MGSQRSRHIPSANKPLYCILSKPNMRASGCTPCDPKINQIAHLCLIPSLVLGGLGHGVKSRAVLEPLDLSIVEGVGQRDLEGLAAIGGVDNEGKGLARLELGAEDIDTVIRSDLVVVGGVSESKREHTLLLQVGLVDTSERAGDDGKTTKVTGLKSGVLSRRALTVVPVTNDNPLDTLGLVVTGDSGNSTPLTIGVVLDLVGFLVGLVDGTNQHVVGDVVKVTTVLQPGTGHGDVVGGGLTLGLDEDGHVLGVLAIPRLERSKDLETVGGRGDIDADAGTVLGGSLVSVLAGVVASFRETVTGGRSKLELLAVLVLQGVGKRVEVERSGDRHGDNQIGRGDERVSGGVTVVSASEVTVVRRDDRVGLTLLDITSVPLTNARTTSVGKDNTTELLEGLELTVTLNGGTDLLGTRGDSEGRLGLDTVVEGITSDRGGTGHILVRGVGARANQTDLELLGPAVLLDSLAELGDRSSQIRSEGTVDVGLELGEIDLDELVVLDVLVRAEAVGVGAGEVTDLLSLGGSKVVVHAVVEGEDGGSGTNLSTLCIVSRSSVIR